MNLHEAIASRRSVRDFLPTPVPEALIRRVLEQALRAPSGGNLQPWHLHVLGGQALADFKQEMQQRLQREAEAAGPGGAPEAETPEYAVYPPELVSPTASAASRSARPCTPSSASRARTRPRACAGLRATTPLRRPLALFCSVDRRMGPPQWADLGMLLQTVMLLLRAEGLDSCPQECWARYPRSVGRVLHLPPERMLFAGMAIGYANPAHPVNRLRSERAALSEVVEFIGF
jgi:nitroreductase